VDYSHDDVVAADKAVMVYDRDIKGTQLSNYFYEASDERAFLSMGFGSLFNHHKPISVDNYWHDKEPSDDRRSADFFTSAVDYYADRHIQRGDEIFNSYGNMGWFSERSIEFNSGAAEEADESLSRPLHDLRRTGHCLSDVGVYESTVPGVGEGLFAERSFKKGEVVSISPLLFIPKHTLLETSATSLLVNYALSLPDSDVSFLPIGRAGMVNNGGKVASLRLHWYDWKSRRVLEGSELPDAMKGLSVDEIEASRFANLDVCYVATRNIEEGEELTLFYGKEWSKAWKLHKKKLLTDPNALFRQFISVSPGMFPSSWMVDCVGKSCNEEAPLPPPPTPVAEENLGPLRTECPLYMATSTVPGVGRGVFAGMSYPKGGLLDISPAVSLPLNMTYNTQLINFIFLSNHDDYAMALLGPDMLLNHKEDPINTAYGFNVATLADIADPSLPQTEPQTGYTPVAFKTTENVNAGQELFTSYGGKKWFSARDIPYEEGSHVNEDYHRGVEDLSAHGHCLSDVSVRDSGIPGAGQGLFAERAFRQGDVVSISPVLVMSKQVLGNSSANSVLLNYAISLDGSDVAVLPIGKAAMANNGGREGASLSMHWYDWDSSRVFYDADLPEVIKRQSIEKIEGSPSASLDISYVATRDIQAGEELTIFYGEQWESAWKAYQGLLWKRKQLIQARGESPVFRQPVGAQPRMFPAAWMVDCIGRACAPSEVRGGGACSLYLATSSLPGMVLIASSIPFCFSYLCFCQ
jgi:hypothetical protein